MRRPRTAGMFVGLFALPAALLGALPAVAWQLSEEIPFVQDDAPRAHGSQQLHRGHKVKITGAAQGQLSPGVSVPIVLTFENPNKHRVHMKRVRVKIAGVSAPNANAAHPCTTADYAIRQMPRKTLLRVRGKRATSLTALHIPMDAWPWLTMLNRPLNQDGCQGAHVTLKFKARGLTK
jgi:hypothetical protein